MSEPYVGEIRMFGGNFAPNGWANCDGALLPISENETLFNLIGTTYGGDGQETFAVPNLNGRASMHMGTGNGLTTRILGEVGGSESVTLTTSQLGGHQHNLMASLDNATGANPGDAVPGTVGTVQIYRSGANGQTMPAQAVDFRGSSQPHDNMQPYLVIRFIISLFGIYPSPS
ncbi:tail fiber protein [Conexibacter sp. JD483]|uniref:phage tail protein n=1 Tax=unclassified Conexibacter TaxID=2627773 RepID=UPI002718DF27|nr:MULTISPECIES: tail fiber protein [unclassified Conexibacter]MDO8186376.1 tail fiber protein [Conexibacter sp. CPCC 205706]MDO8199775.1 tail fiber protein [Conexibacter sp. CPCC 205762]MDR9371132.1 tail fiber protein [Conexibacter sp. JD483]